MDEADVTLNVCLGKEFTGGNLYFGGVRCVFHQQTAPQPHEEFVFAHKRGQGIFHLSKHRHLAQHISSGERHNLIIWCRSSCFQVDKFTYCFYVFFVYFTSSLSLQLSRKNLLKNIIKIGNALLGATLTQPLIIAMKLCKKCMKGYQLFIMNT